MRKREARKKKKKEKRIELNCSLEMKFLRASLDLWRNSPPPLLLLLQRTTRRKLWRESVLHQIPRLTDDEECETENF